MSVGEVIRMPRSASASLSLLIEAVERLSGAETEVQVAAIVRTAARKLTGADGISVVLRRGDRVAYVDEDAVGPLWKGQDFPIEACISGWAMLNRETVVIEDVFQDPRIPVAAYRPTFVKSLVMAPVRPHDPIAAIGAYWAEHRRPTDDEIHALQTVARAAAVALENAQLRTSLQAAVDEAQAADVAKSAFLANMSHEIRTPLNAVVALVDLIGRTPLGPQQKEMIDLVSSSSEHLVQIVSDILDFSKIEAGRADLMVAPLDLASTVRSAAQLFAAQAQKQGLKLEIDIDAAAEGVFFGDEARIKQIVSNLVSNAIKYTDAGSVAVKLEIEDQVADKAMVLLHVEDTGLGFDESMSETLFQRFTQGDGNLSKRYGGVGLGLSIANALVNAMGGAIEAKSKPALGSVFTVRLPLQREAALGSDEVLIDDEPSVGKRLRILCAEDHPTNQTVLRLSLASLGADVLMVKDGQEAVDAATSAPPDVILMDMQMPVMDGLEATRRIRAHEESAGRNRTPIVMVTAHAMRDHVTAAFLAGVDGFVPKPMTPARLAEAIRDAIDGGSGVAAHAQ
ncbi:MAG: response regulator [Pseudomonadota bacterium]